MVNRKILRHIGLCLCGAAVGVVIAYSIARAIQFQTGREELERYADRLLGKAPQLAVESDNAVAAVLSAHLPFCSDEELALIRNYVYNSPQVKHIGRQKDGMLYCTSGVGRLSPPQTMPAHTDLTVDGIHFYGLARLVFNSQARGLVVEHDNVSVVFNPDSYKGLDELPMLSSGFVYDHRNSLAVHIFGHVVPLSSSEVAAEKFIERDGTYYQPQCSERAMLCVVASETRGSMTTRSKWFFRVFLIGGALLGSALALIFILFYHRQRSMEMQLRRAIRKGTLTLVYQPVIDLETRTIVAAEALARWVNEEGQPVSPDVFVSLAEKKGFARDLTRMVMQRAVSELGDLLATGDLRVTVNITAQDLVDPEFFAFLELCLHSAKAKPSAIGLELTERSTANHSVAINAIARLKKAGHTVYIDDFGTGYSSLSYLHRLGGDAIKIDRSFTQTIGTEAVTASVVPQILEMAFRLDLLVVVEGIETREQAEYFRRTSRGLLGQGYLFSRPVPAAQLKKLVSEWTVATFQ